LRCFSESGMTLIIVVCKILLDMQERKRGVAEIKGTWEAH
jgi:hypothetical protein